MTRLEIEEKYFVEFLKWCALPPDGKATDLLFWLDYHFATFDNFWEWVVKYKADELGERQKAGINGQA